MRCGASEALPRLERLQRRVRQLHLRTKHVRSPELQGLFPDVSGMLDFSLWVTGEAMLSTGDRTEACSFCRLFMARGLVVISREDVSRDGEHLGAGLIDCRGRFFNASFS